MVSSARAAGSQRQAWRCWLLIELTQVAGHLSTLQFVSGAARFWLMAMHICICMLVIMLILVAHESVGRQLCYVCRLRCKAYINVMALWCLQRA